MALKVILADESKNALELLKFKMHSVFEDQLQVVASCTKPAETLGSVFLHQPDILILDIALFEDQHLDVVERLIVQTNGAVKTILTIKDHQVHKIQRFVEIGIAGLLMKPVSTEDLKKLLTKLIARRNNNNSTPKQKEEEDQFITFKSNRARLLIHQPDILLIESNRNICTLTLKDGTQKTLNENISSIESRLTHNDLVRIDKSTIVNTAKVVFLDSDIYNKCCKLRLENGEEITRPLTKTGVERLYKITTKA